MQSRKAAPLLDSTQNATLVCIVVYKRHPTPFGAVAQLGERMTGSHEVRGSIPLGSTNFLWLAREPIFLSGL